MLDVLLKHFKEAGIIDEVLAAQIERVKNVRNTFHLSKDRRGHISNERAEEAANNAVVGTIKVVRAALTGRKRV